MKSLHHTALCVFLCILLLPHTALTPPVLAQPPEQAVDPNAKILLRLRLKAGQSFLLDTSTKISMLSTRPGSVVDIQQTMTFGIGLRVLSVDDDGALNIEMSYRYIRLKMQGDGTLIDYDSDHPPAQLDLKANPRLAISAAMFGALKAQVLTMKLSPSGQVREVKGLEASWERMIEVIEDMELLQEPQREAVLKMMENTKTQLGAQSQERMRTSLAFFSEKPVGIGDSWQSPAPTDKEATLHTDTFYTLKSRQKGMATIVIGSQFHQTSPAAAPDNPMMPEVNMSGTQIGTIEIDEATGITRRGQMTLLNTGSITLKPLNAEPNITPIHSTSIITITGSEDINPAVVH